MTSQIGPWTWTKIAGGDVRDAIGDCGFALDAEQRAHFVHSIMVSPANRVCYLKPDSDRWWSHGLEGVQWFGPGPVALAVRANHAHIAYLMRANADAATLYYARHEGVWPDVWFYLDQYNPWFCDICLDADADPVIVFYAGAPRNQLMLARWNKAGGPPYLIVEEITPPDGRLGYWPSCRFDSDGALHIAHFENFVIRPFHSFRRPGGAWQHEPVDGKGSGGYQPSLAFLNGTTPVIAYTTASPTTHDNSTIRLATRQSDGSWQHEDLPGKTMQGESLSLAIDSRGRPHLLRFDAPNFGVSLSLREGKSWVSERLLAGAGYGFRLRLALDNNQCPKVGVARRESFWASYLYQGARRIPFEPANASKQEPLPLDPSVVLQKQVIGPLNVAGSPGGTMPTFSPSNSGGNLPD